MKTTLSQFCLTFLKIKYHILEITLKLDLYINYRNTVFDAESLPKKVNKNLSTRKAKT